MAGASEEAPRGSATYEYGGRAFLGGLLDGSCEAAAVLFPLNWPGFFTLQSRGGVIEHYTTDWWGGKVDPAGLAPYHTRIHANQSAWTQDVPSGHGKIEWGPGGRVRVFGNHWMQVQEYPEPDRFTAGFRLVNVNLTEVSPDIARHAEGYYLSQRDSVTGRVELTSILQGGVWGWNRMVQSLGGNLTAEGDVTVYLQDARVAIEQGYSYRTPPWNENATYLGPETSKIYHYRYHHSILRLRQAQIVVDSSPPLACGRLEGEVEGTLVLYGARGMAQRSNQTVRFDKQELTLGGAFRMVEDVPQQEPVYGTSGRIRSRAAGEISVVGVDFEPVIVPLASSLDAANLVVWTAVAAAGTLAGWKLIGWLFTRIGRRAAEQHPVRSDLMEALRHATPAWKSQNELAQLTGHSIDGRFRFHLRMLVDLGLVAVRTVRCRPVYALPSRASEFAAFVDGLRKEPWLRELLMDRLTPEPRPAHQVLKELRGRRKVSKQAFGKVVQKLHREGRIVSERRGQEVWICASTASPS